MAKQVNKRAKARKGRPPGVVLDGEKLKALRTSKGWTQGELATGEMGSVDVKRVYNAEKGISISMDTATFFAGRLGLPLEALLPTAPIAGASTDENSETSAATKTPHVYKLEPLTKERVKHFLQGMKRTNLPIKFYFDISPYEKDAERIEQVVRLLQSFTRSVLRSRDGAVAEIRALGKIPPEVKALEEINTFTYFTAAQWWAVSTYDEFSRLEVGDRGPKAPKLTTQVHVRLTNERKDFYQLSVLATYEAALEKCIAHNLAIPVEPRRLDQLPDPPFTAEFKAAYRAAFEKRYPDTASKD